MRMSDWVVVKVGGAIRVMRLRDVDDEPVAVDGNFRRLRFKLKRAAEDFAATL